ncbi:MAG: response regulator [Candidatus Acidiferrales bacterium]
MLTPQTVLIISNEEKNRMELERTLVRYGLKTAQCGTVTVAKMLISRGKFAAVFCEQALADGDYHDVIREICQSDAGTPVIVISGFGDWEGCVAAMAGGAFDFLRLPVNPEELERILLLVLEHCVECEECPTHAAD